MKRLAIFLLIILAAASSEGVQAQTLDASNFRIEWQVVNRFRLFRDPAFFTMHVNAWRQYLLHVGSLNIAAEDRDGYIERTSVLGSEHVLNDRRIAFSDVLRTNFDWRGWAAKGIGKLCYDFDSRRYKACGGLGSYLNPASHGIELWLSASNGATLPQGARCEWHIGGQLVATAGCGARVSGPDIALPYPDGADISVNVVGEQPITVPAQVRDILIAGLGDSFASGEGNPDEPVQFGDQQRFRNLYPLRAENNGAGSAQWTDTLCHRSLYGQQLRASLQIAIENPHAAVTFLDYSCSGAGVDEGILGGQTYVERQGETDASSMPAGRPLSGGAKDSQLYRLLHDLCTEDPDWKHGQWVCPGNKFRRPIDLVFLSIGGNDIGFSNVVAWATLRDGVSAAIAQFFGATVSADDFAAKMHEVLPDAYARLAKAMESSLPVFSANDGVFDPSRVILTSYPDLVTNERGDVCEASDGGDQPDDVFTGNQSLDMFSSWLSARADRLAAVRKDFSNLYRVMRDLAGDHGWTFAGHAYADKMFEGHGFCARNPKMASDPAEELMIPCWGKADRDTETCQSSWSGKVKDWRPYDPATQNYPYALRQRWVRTFNDAYMTINQKVTDRFGKINEKVSAGVFSETTGALHPSAEGGAALADGLLLSVRPIIHDMLADQ